MLKENELQIKQLQSILFYFNKGSHDYLYVKEFTHIDEPSNNDHPTLLFPAALQSLIGTFSSLGKIIDQNKD